jgi:antitoxin FitA
LVRRIVTATVAVAAPPRAKNRPKYRLPCSAWSISMSGRRQPSTPSMLVACYFHAMSAIQVKGVPADLHERLRARARAEGRSLSDYVLYLIERDLALPTMREWLERLKEDEPVTGVSSEDVLAALHEGRAERDAQIQRAISDRD